MQKRPTKTKFYYLFGDNPNLRIIEYLISKKESDFYYKDLVRESNVGYACGRKVFDILLKKGIIILKKSNKRYSKCCLNIDNEIVLNLIKLFQLLR
jgi:hypothetical protein